MYIAENMVLLGAKPETTAFLYCFTKSKYSAIPFIYCHSRSKKNNVSHIYNIYIIQDWSGLAFEAECLDGCGTYFQIYVGYTRRQKSWRVECFFSFNKL